MIKSKYNEKKAPKLSVCVLYNVSYEDIDFRINEMNLGDSLCYESCPLLKEENLRWILRILSRLRNFYESEIEMQFVLVIW